MYEYGNIEDAKPGDIVERIKKGSSNEPYHQIGYLAVVGNDFPESEGCRPSLSKEWWKLVKTLAGSEAKVGDTVIFTKDSRFECLKQTIGQLGVVNELSNGIWIYTLDGLNPIGHYCGTQLEEFKVLRKAEPESTEKHNLAFYKRSGEPWTTQECENIVRYVGATYQISNENWGNLCPSRRYMFDDGTNRMYMANWYDQEEDSNFANCKQVAYEDISKTSHSEENTDTPRVAVVTVSVGGHPIGSRIVPTDVSNHSWKLADGSKPFTYGHAIGYNCEWEDTLTTCTNTVTDDISPATECSQPTPRVAVVTVNVGGHPVGSRIIPAYKNTTNYWILANNSSSKHYHHSLGGSCEWEDELVGSTWEQIDSSGPRNAGDITTISKISKNEHIHYYDSNSSLYKHFFKMFKKYNHLEATKPEPAAPCSQHDDIVDAISYITQTIPEEETMNKENITIAMTADEYAKYQKSNKLTKPKSQLETAPKWFTIWYGVNGNVDCQTTESPKKAKKALQHPSKLGFTFRSYLITESATTDIPVVSVEI